MAQLRLLLQLDQSRGEGVKIEVVDRHSITLVG